MYFNKKRGDKWYCIKIEEEELEKLRMAIIKKYSSYIDIVEKQLGTAPIEYKMNILDKIIPNIEIVANNLAERKITELEGKSE